MKTNTQLPERPFLHPQGALHIQKVFPTIQGEGPFAGMPAIFVRLAGCNLQCPFCDTDYTSQRKTMDPMEVTALVRQTVRGLNFTHDHPLVVITGGEPFRQNLTPLVTLLLGFRFMVQIETNGTYFLEGFPYSRVVLVCSPKTGRINHDFAIHVDAFKYVIQAGHVDPVDGLPTTVLGQTGPSVARPPMPKDVEIYVQPLDEQDERKNVANAAATVNSCLNFGYRLCIQTHKLVNLD